MKKIVFILMLTTFSAFAEIRESIAISDVYDYVTADTLVVFDLDNTVMEPTQTLGSDQWFGYLVDSYINLGFEKDSAIERAIVVWQGVQMDTWMAPVEDVTPQIIYHLQQHGVRTIGLTARPVELANRTIEQLAAIGIDFSITNYDLSNSYVNSEFGAIFQNGIILVGPKNNKGHVLAQFMLDKGLLPERVIFFDDKQKHVENVGSFLSQLQISYVGLRYGAADYSVFTFSEEIANIQWQYYESCGELISDFDASMLPREFTCN